MWKSITSGSGRSSSHRKKSRGGSVVSSSSSSRKDKDRSERSSTHPIAPSSRAGESESAPHSQSLTESATRALSKDDDDEEDDHMGRERRSKTSSGDERKHHHRRLHRPRDEGGERRRSRSRDRKDIDKHSRPSSKVETSGRSERSDKSRGKGRAEDLVEGSGGERGIPAQGSFDQFPGQYSAALVGPQASGSSSASLPQNQSPSQEPSSAEKPPLMRVPTRGDSYGQASEYYNDEGESVKRQPGVRPGTPIIAGTEPHLQAASVEEHIAQDTGHGSAADFYSGDASLPSSPSKPIAAKSSKPSRTSALGSILLHRPSKSSGKMNDTAAAAAAGVLDMGSSKGQPRSLDRQSSSGFQQDTSYQNTSQGASSSFYQQGSNPPGTPSVKGTYRAPFRQNSAPIAEASSYYAPSPSGIPPKQVGSGRTPSQSSNVPLLAAAGAAAAGAYALHEHNEYQQQKHNDAYSAASQFVGSQHSGTQYGARPGMPHQHSSYMNTQYRHEHRGPMMKLKDGFLNMLSSPEDVRKMEEYTEYIGVCRYCFDPRSTPGDAPRRHQNGGKRSMENMRKHSSDSLRRPSSRIEKSSRYDKQSGYYSSDTTKRSKRGKSSVGVGLLGAGIAGYGGFGNNKNFDDTYSIKSGHRESSRRRYSRSPTGMSRGVVNNKDSESEYVYVRTKEGKTVKQRRRRSRSSSRDRKSALLGAATGAALGAAMASSSRSRRSREHSPERASIRQSGSGRPNEPQGAFVRHRSRSRSRSHSPGLGSIFGFTDTKSRRNRRQSPDGSYYDISRSARPAETTGFLGGFFSSPDKKRKTYRKKQRGFFNFGNGSSSDSDLAWGEGFARRTNRGRGSGNRRKNSDEHLAATMASIGATAAAIHAAQRGSRVGKRTSRPDLTSASGRRHDRGAVLSSNRRHDHEPGEEEWEDEDDIDDDRSVSSGLAFGDFDYKGKRPAHKQSVESLASQSSGTNKWGWRWGGETKRKQRRQSPPPPMYPPRPSESFTGPLAAGLVGAGIAGTAIDVAGRPYRAGGAMTSTGGIPTMQYIEPRPMSETGSRQSLPGGFDTDVPVQRPGPAPLQQPQPITPIQPAFTQGSFQSGFTAPSGARVFTAEPSPITQPSYNGAPTPRRSQSSPGSTAFLEDAALIGAGAAATAGILAMSGKYRDGKSREGRRSSEVLFELTDAQKGREERKRRKERERAEEERRGDEERRKRENEERRRADRARALKEEAERHTRERQAAEEEERRRKIVEREAQQLREVDRQRQAEQERQAQNARQQEIEATSRREQGRLAEMARQQQEEWRQREALTAKAREQGETERRYREEEDRRQQQQQQQRDVDLRAQREREIQAEIGRKQRELQDQQTSTRGAHGWVAPAAIGLAGATAAAVLAGKEHERHEDSRSRGGYAVKPIEPTDGSSGEPVMDDDIMDPDFFKHKRSPSDYARQSEIARRAADRVISDMEDRYNEPAQSQADFFAPKDLLSKAPDGKTRVADANGDNDVQVYGVPQALTGNGLEQYMYDHESVKGRPRSATEPVTWGVPRLNVIAPTPPHSIAGSAKGERSGPPSPLVELQDRRSATFPVSKRAGSKVTWGEDRTHEYDVETPDSHKDQYVSSHDISAQKTLSHHDKIVVEPQSTGRESEKTTYHADIFATHRSEGTSPGFEPQKRFYQWPSYETVSDLGFGMESPGTEGAPPVQGFVEGETDEPIPLEEPGPHIPGAFDDANEELLTPTPVREVEKPLLSKKERKKREEAASFGGVEEVPPAAPSPPPVVEKEREPELEPEFEPTLSKKEKKKREKAAKHVDPFEDFPEMPAPIVEEPASVIVEPAEEPADYFLSKKDKKKRDKAAKRGLTDTGDVSEPSTPLPEPSSFTAVDPEPEPVREVEPEPELAFEVPLSKKEKKKREKAAMNQGSDDVAAAFLGGGVATGAVHEEDDWSSDKKGKGKKDKKSKTSGWDARDIGPPLLYPTGSAAVEPPRMRESGRETEAAANPRLQDEEADARRDAPETSSRDAPVEADPYAEFSGTKKSKKKKRTSDRFASPAASSPLRSVVPLDDSIGNIGSDKSREDVRESDGNGEAAEELVRKEPLFGSTTPLAYSNVTPCEHETSHDYVQEIKHGASKEQLAQGYIDDAYAVNEGRHRSRLTESPEHVSPDDYRSVASAPVHVGGRKTSKSSRSSGRDPDYLENDRERDERSVAASEPVDVHESSRRHRHRSRRDNNDDDDTVSGTSSRSRRQEEDSPKEERKKRGILGIFKRKSSDGVPPREEAIAELDEDVGKSHRRKHRSSQYGDEDDTRSVPSESRHRHHRSRSEPFDNEDDATSLQQRHHHKDGDRASPRGSEAGHRRHRHHDDKDDDTSSKRSGEGSHRHHHIRRTDENDDEGETSRYQNGKRGDEDAGERDQSFLGERVEDLPPLLDSQPLQPSLTLSLEEKAPGIPSSAERGVEAFQELTHFAPGTTSREVQHSEELVNVPTALFPAETRDVAAGAEEVQPAHGEYHDELPPLPVSRPDSPVAIEETPQRPTPLVRPISTTAIPLRFRRPPASPGQPQKERSASFSSPPSTTPVSPISGPKARQGRPHSTEFRLSHEFRPLYLVERNRQTPDVEETLPSLPLSRVTSRASSVHGSDEYQSAAEDWASPDSNRSLSINTGEANRYQPGDDILDSQQNTPKASDFPSHSFERLPKAEPQFYSWSDLEEDERLHRVAVQEPSLATVPATNIPHLDDPFALPHDALISQPAPLPGYDNAHLPALPSSRPASPYQREEEHHHSGIGAGTAAAAVGLGAGAVALEVFVYHEERQEDDVWGEVVAREEPLSDEPAVAHRDALRTIEEPSRAQPTLTRSTSSKKADKTKKKKGRAASLGNLSLSEPSTPLKVTPEELQRRRERDAQDAVDTWFDHPTAPIETPTMGKKGKKGRQSSLPVSVAEDGLNARVLPGNGQEDFPGRSPLLSETMNPSAKEIMVDPAAPGPLLPTFDKSILPDSTTRAPTEISELASTRNLERRDEFPSVHETHEQFDPRGQMGVQNEVLPALEAPALPLPTQFTPEASTTALRALPRDEHMQSGGMDFDRDHSDAGDNLIQRLDDPWMTAPDPTPATDAVEELFTTPTRKQSKKGKGQTKLRGSDFMERSQMVGAEPAPESQSLAEISLLNSEETPREYKGTHARLEEDAAANVPPVSEAVQNEELIHDLHFPEGLAPVDETSRREDFDLRVPSLNEPKRTQEIEEPITASETFESDALRSTKSLRATDRELDANESRPTSAALDANISEMDANQVQAMLDAKRKNKKGKKTKRAIEWFDGESANAIDSVSVADRFDEPKDALVEPLATLRPGLKSKKKKKTNKVDLWAEEGLETPAPARMQDSREKHSLPTAPFTIGGFERERGVVTVPSSKNKLEPEFSSTLEPAEVHHLNHPAAPHTLAEEPIERIHDEEQPAVHDDPSEAAQSTWEPYVDHHTDLAQIVPLPLSPSTEPAAGQNLMRESDGTYATASDTGMDLERQDHLPPMSIGNTDNAGPGSGESYRPINVFAASHDPAVYTRNGPNTGQPTVTEENTNEPAEHEPLHDADEVHLHINNAETAPSAVSSMRDPEYGLVNSLLAEDTLRVARSNDPSAKVVMDQHTDQYTTFRELSVVEGAAPAESSEPKSWSITPTKKGRHGKKARREASNLEEADTSAVGTGQEPESTIELAQVLPVQDSVTNDAWETPELSKKGKKSRNDKLVTAAELELQISGVEQSLDVVRETTYGTSSFGRSDNDEETAQPERTQQDSVQSVELAEEDFLPTTTSKKKVKKGKKAKPTDSTGTITPLPETDAQTDWMPAAENRDGRGAALTADANLHDASWDVMPIKKMGKKEKKTRLAEPSETSTPIADTEVLVSLGVDSSAGPQSLASASIPLPEVPVSTNETEPAGAADLWTSSTKNKKAKRSKKVPKYVWDETEGGEAPQHGSTMPSLDVHEHGDADTNYREVPMAPIDSARIDEAKNHALTGGETGPADGVYPFNSRNEHGKSLPALPDSPALLDAPHDSVSSERGQEEDVGRSDSNTFQPSLGHTHQSVIEPPRGLHNLRQESETMLESYEPIPQATQAVADDPERSLHTLRYHADHRDFDTAREDVPQSATATRSLEPGLPLDKVSRSENPEGQIPAETSKTQLRSIPQVEVALMNKQIVEENAIAESTTPAFGAEDRSTEWTNIHDTDIGIGDFESTTQPDHRRGASTFVTADDGVPPVVSGEIKHADSRDPSAAQGGSADKGNRSPDDKLPTVAKPATLPEGAATGPLDEWPQFSLKKSKKDKRKNKRGSGTSSLPVDGADESFQVADEDETARDIPTETTEPPLVDQRLHTGEILSPFEPVGRNKSKKDKKKSRRHVGMEPDEERLPENQAGDSKPLHAAASDAEPSYPNILPLSTEVVDPPLRSTRMPSGVPELPLSRDVLERVGVEKQYPAEAISTGNLQDRSLRADASDYAQRDSPTNNTEPLPNNNAQLTSHGHRLVIDPASRPFPNDEMDIVEPIAHLATTQSRDHDSLGIAGESRFTSEQGALEREMSNQGVHTQTPKAYEKAVEEPNAPHPTNDIDFAATLAAGLATSGFDPDLVVNDPAFHRRATPPSATAEADPEEAPTTSNKKGNKAKTGRKTRASSDEEGLDSTTTPEAINERSEPLKGKANSDDFSATLAKGLKDAGFNAALLEQSNKEADLELDLEDPVAFSISKSKKKKEKKRRKVFDMDSGIETPAEPVTMEAELAEDPEPTFPHSADRDVNDTRFEKYQSAAEEKPVETMERSTEPNLVALPGTSDLDPPPSNFSTFREPHSTAVSAFDPTAEVPSSDQPVQEAGIDKWDLPSKKKMKGKKGKKGEQTSAAALPDTETFDETLLQPSISESPLSERTVDFATEAASIDREPARLRMIDDDDNFQPSTKSKRKETKQRFSLLPGDIPNAQGYGVQPRRMHQEALAYDHQSQMNRDEDDEVVRQGRSSADTPGWSFANLNDGAATLPKEPLSTLEKERHITRDSGYQEVSSPSLDRNLPARSTSRESLRSRRSAEPIKIAVGGVQDWDLHVQNKSSRKAIRDLPDADVKQTRVARSQTPTPIEDETASAGLPPPVDSTTKHRTSYLFQSPPAFNQRDFGSINHDSETSAEKSNAREYFDARSPAAEQSSFHCEQAGTGAPHNRGVVSPSVDHGSGPSEPLHTIQEHDAEEQHPFKKTRTASDVGAPDRGVKAARRSRTPQAFVHDRPFSPLREPRQLASTESAPMTTALHPISTDDIIAGMSWPSVDEEKGVGNNDRTLEKSSKRVLSDQRSPSVLSNRSAGSATYRRTPDQMRSYSVASNRTATPPLRRVSLSGDLRAASMRGEAQGSAARSGRSTTITMQPPPTPPLNEEDVVEQGAARAAGMASVYQGYGDAQGSPASPTRPPNMRKRQSMHVMDLEARLDQLVSENRMLQEAKHNVEQTRDASSYQRDVDSQALHDAVLARDLAVQEKDAEIHQIKAMLESLQSEVARLTEVNGGLTESNRDLPDHTNDRFATLQQEHAHAHAQWQGSSRELYDLRQQHGQLTNGMESIVREEIASALRDKELEIRRLREELDIATQQIRALQQQIQDTRPNDFLTQRDEDYFDGACQKLCQHVQQWVLRFSKCSDDRICRLSSDLKDEKIETRLDNAVLDGSDVDKLLCDRTKRRDVFMSVVMTMIWEYVFTRYLFGMDREQRQKLKALEKILSEVGPSRAVAQWRATTLTLLSNRPAFASQCALDTEAVAHEIYSVLAALLPPPSAKEPAVIASLQSIMRLSVELSIEMRTQRAEYIMLPPLQPEYDTNGELVRKVHFNASLMNERSGQYSSNEELEQERSIVKIVLFPLVVKKGDDSGEGEEEIVVCPAQVLVQGDRTGKKVVRVMSGAMEIDDPRRSRQSLVSTVLGSTGQQGDEHFG